MMEAADTNASPSRMPDQPSSRLPVNQPETKMEGLHATAVAAPRTNPLIVNLKMQYVTIAEKRSHITGMSL